MAKKIKTIVKIVLPAGRAAPSQQTGTALGPHGINIGLFIKDFNERSAPLGDIVVPAEITIFEDRSFTFIEAGGVLRINVNDRSSKIVISAGTTISPRGAERSLKSFMNNPMLIPWGPKAVPVCWLGAALPAGSTIFTIVLIFLAI